MNQDYKDLLSAFHAHGVRYLIVGGYAVILHAQPRFTRDIDFFIRPDPANARATYAALAEFGATLQGIRPEDFTDRNTAAQVTGTVAESQSDFNEGGGSGYLGICYKPAGDTGLTAVSQVLIDVPYDFAISGGATVSGIVGNLTPGEYYVGLCAEDQGPKGGGDSSVINGDASVTIIMAETASRVSYGTRGDATRMHSQRRG